MFKMRSFVAFVILLSYLGSCFSLKDKGRESFIVSLTRFCLFGCVETESKFPDSYPLFSGVDFLKSEDSLKKDLSSDEDSTNL